MLDWRVEEKFIVTDAQIILLKARLSALLQRDPHQAGDCYRIRSLYFDDRTFSAFGENEAGTDERSKYRIRYYGSDPVRFTLECKSKSHAKTHKAGCPVSREFVTACLSGDIPLPDSTRPPVMNRFLLSAQTAMLAPAAIIEYERDAYVFAPGNVRVTFDRNISVCGVPACFPDRDFHKIPILPPGEHVLEVKYDEFLPDFIADLLETGKLRQTSFSKYYLGRMAVTEGDMTI